MHLEQREKLNSFEHKYISIGISEEGISYNMLPVPWERTAHAYNMRTPDIYLAKEDLTDEEILGQLEKFEVIGCYIFTPLEDYSFLKRFPKIQDLYIREGYAIRDLAFMSGMEEWFMFVLEGAKLKTLNEIPMPESAEGRIRAYCMAFYDCEVEDVSALLNRERRLSELIIWNKRTEEDYQKWKCVPAMTFRYYDKER